MKYIITEGQLDRIKDDILTIPYSAFNNHWKSLQKFLDKRGNPPYILRGNLDLKSWGSVNSLGPLIKVIGNVNLYESDIESLGNLTHVSGNMNLQYTGIKSLGNLTSVGEDLVCRSTPIRSLGNLTSVGRTLNMFNTFIESLGNLSYVGLHLDIRDTPLSYTHTYTKEQIRDMVKVDGEIYL